MVKKVPFIICTALISMLLLNDLAAQSSTARWALSVGGAGSRYNGTEAQVLPRTASFFPSGKIAATRYLRPGFNFRTQVEFSPAVVDPTISEDITSQYFSFQYAFMVKLNNGIILREDAKIAPYAYLGAGGSYHASRPDAYSPFGAGIALRLGSRSALQLEVNRNISWNKSPQVLTAGINYVYVLNSKSQEILPVGEEDKPATEDIIASQKPSDSDGDGVFDNEDDCPYEPGYIQNGGCPEEPIPASEELVADATQPEQDSIPEVNDESESVENRISAVLEEEGLVFSPEFVSDSSSAELSVEMTPEPPEEVAVVIPEVESGEVVEESNVEPCTVPGEISITFKKGSSELSSEARDQLNELAIALKECPTISLSLIGYANDRATEDGNLVLSIKRAFNVKYYLVYQHGISQGRIFSKGAGSDHKDRSPRSVSFSWSS